MKKKILKQSVSKQGVKLLGICKNRSLKIRAPDSTDSLGAVSSHNHQDKKGKALEAPLPLWGEGGRSGEDCVTASS